MKTILHVGSGKSGALGPGFPQDEWREVTYDLDPQTFPDIVGDMRDLGILESDTFDAVFTSHTIEHLFPLEVKKTLEEYLRVLKRDGILVIACPDLEAAAQEIVKGRLLETVYESDGGAIAPIDIIYGYRGFYTLPERHEFMIHKTGFTLPVLKRCVEAVGFPSVIAKQYSRGYEIWVVASKAPLPPERLEELAQKHIPV